MLHVAVVSVWFVRDGKRSESFDQMGGTKAAYRTKKGDLIVDEDAGKKSVTDGMVKCLSMIGFAGDIFSVGGMTQKYVEFARGHFDNKPDPAEEAQRLQWIADQKARIVAAKNVGELKKVMDEALAVTSQMNDQDATDQLLAASEEKVATAKAKASKETV